jgi:hypothetical protein
MEAQDPGGVVPKVGGSSRNSHKGLTHGEIHATTGCRLFGEQLAWKMHV